MEEKNRSIRNISKILVNKGLLTVDEQLRMMELLEKKGRL